MSDSIQVAIKVRPLIKRERDENLQIQWAVLDNVIFPVDPEKKRGELGFQFDHIFDPDKLNNDVFEIVVKPIVDAAVKGFNGTVFAYGQTSSGKTHTMLGTTSEPGIIPMAVERTFDSIAETVGREFLLRVTYLEIYNEKVNDLLDTTGLDLKLREDSNGLVQVLKCKEEIASSPDVIMSIMKKGDKNRRIGETDMNERSSRSHTIFRITIESRDLSSDSDGAIQVSQLNLVDLAGSERARQTNATGERFKEGTHINMSLSTLGLVIKQLSESSDPTKYINFRDSKLTRLLQASLGGNAMTTIICAVTPAAFEETQCTLSFASRAKSVKNKPQLNEVMSDAALLKRYKKQLAKLNEELEKVKNVNRIAEVEEMESKLQEKEHKLQETDRMNQLLEERIQLLKNGIISAESATRDDSNTKIPRSKRRRTWAGDRALNSRFSLCARNLPTIKEISCTSPDSNSNHQDLDNIRRRKSIIQTVNLNDESFQTAFTDFELELIKGAKEREEATDVTIDCFEEKDFRKIKPKSENRVKFQDDVEIYRLSTGSNYSTASTPEKRRSTSSQGDRTQETPSSPGTPKAVLRERLSYITEEYNALQEFTTLERQMLSAQQMDFESPTEKIYMQNQIEELLKRLRNYSTYQTELEEQLTISLNCINGLSSRTSDVLEMWKPSLFSDEKGEVDTISELKQLEELLKNFNSEPNNAERELSPREKKLTDDYNECLQELEQVQSQKELLFKENVEMKKKLVDESNKLKNTNILVNTLRTDTDCLMEKLIQKNSELAKLKERVVDLEKVNNEMVSTKNENNVNVLVNSSLITEEAQDKDTEISRLNEIIQEKTLEITKYRQFEEEIKIENERLQQQLDAASKIERKSEECQTENISEHRDQNERIDSDQNKDAEILKLSEIIKEKAVSITTYQQLEEEMKQKIQQLQECVDAISKVKISQECQTENLSDDEKENSLLVDQSKEISRLSEVIQEKTLEIGNYKQLKENMEKQIDRLQNETTVVKVERKSEGCQTLYFYDLEEDTKTHISLEKDLEISRLEGVIQEMTLEITRYMKSEEEARKEIQCLQFRLGNAIEKTSEQCQTEDVSDFTNIDQDKSNEISGLLELIQLKSADIERYKQSEEEMRTEIERLQKCLENMKKVEQISVECQTKQLTEKYDEVDTKQEQASEVSRRSEIIQNSALEIEKYKEVEEVMRKEIERLQQCLNDAKNNVVSVECQTVHVPDSGKLNDADLNQEKDNEIVRQLEIIEKKNLELEKYQQTETEMKHEIEQLLYCLNNLKKTEPLSTELNQVECAFENNTIHSSQEKEEIAKLTKVIDEKEIEIAQYRHDEQEARNEVELLKESLKNVKEVDQMSGECKMDLNQEKDKEILKLSESIQQKELEHVQYKHKEQETINDMERLRQSLENVEKVDQTSAELLKLIQEKELEIVQYKHNEQEIRKQMEQLQQSLYNAEKINETSAELSKTIEEKELELVQYKHNEQETIKEMERLQQSLENVEKVNQTSAELLKLIQEKELEIVQYKHNEQEIRKEMEQLQQSLYNAEKVNETTAELSKTIEEKEFEIARYKQSEEETRKEIEHLQQSLDNAKKVEQTLAESSKLIEDKELEIAQYKHNEQEIRKEMEQLQQSLYNAEKVNETSAELSKTIEEKEFEIARYKQSEEETRKEIEYLQQSLDNAKKIEQTLAESSKLIEDKELEIAQCKHNEQEIRKEMEQLQESLDNARKVEHTLAESSKIIEEKELEIVQFKQSEQETRKEIERLQQNLNNAETDHQTSAELLKIIEEKDLEIAQLKHNEQETRKEIESLQQSLDNAEEVNQMSAELSKVIEGKQLEIAQLKHYEQETRKEIESLQQSLDNAEQVNQTSAELSKIIEEKDLEIVQYKQSEQETRSEIERLQQCLDSLANVERVSKECQTESVPDIEEHNNADLAVEKDNEIARLSQIVEEKTQEIAIYKQSVEATQTEIEHLKECLENASEVLQTAQEMQTAEELASVSENAASEPEPSSQIKAYQEEIETLKEQAEISREDSATVTAELEARVASLGEELSAKIKDIQELSSLNSALKHGIDEKTSEIASMQRAFEVKLRELERNVEVIALERNELKDKIDSVHSNDVAYGFEREVVNLRGIVDKLKVQNDDLKRRIGAFEMECSKTNLSMNETSKSLVTPIKSSATSVMDDVNSSVMSPMVKLEDNEVSMRAVEENVAVSVDDHSFAKPENVLMDKSKVSTPASAELNVTNAVSDDKSFVKLSSKSFELESSSIFANQTYFDNMEVGQSFVQEDCTAVLPVIDESKDISSVSANIDTSLASNHVTVNETAGNATVLFESGKDVSTSEDTQSVSLVKIESEPLTLEELEKIKVALEKENARLRYDLEKKIHETDEVQRVVSDFKQTLEDLQQTIYILTNENMDMSKQLTEARENNNQVARNFQTEIDALTARLSTISEEKVSLKSELALLNDQFDNVRTTTPVITDDEMKHKFFEYQDKIKTLTDENIELSTNLMEKIEELEKVKESKIQLYDHECAYREKSDSLFEKVDCLEKENIELSSDLTEQIEECDKLRETLDVLKQQLEAYESQQSPECAGNSDLEFFKQDNARLTSELIELRAKLTQLSRENANLSSNPTLDNSDERNASLNSSALGLETSSSEAKAGEAHDVSATSKKLKYLEEQVEHLSLLNKKLGELKLTNCSQCAHLKELNESRRELKLEVKSLNQKLADLQKKFLQKCADTEVLRTKANEDFNASLSLMDSTLNGTIYDGLNVTVIEEKVQNLHCELEELKENHNKLSNQYKEKCNELEKLQFDNNALGSPTEKKEARRSKGDSSSRKTSTRIQKLEKDLEKLSTELQELKKSSANVSGTLNKFMIERNETMKEIESLKLSNDELRKECGTARASSLHHEEKVKLLEEELATLYKRIDAANVTEKEIQAQKLEIEVQLESLLKEKSDLASSMQDAEEKFKKELEDCNARVNSYDKENINLKNELQNLQDLIQQLKGKNENYLQEKLQDEIESAKSRIMKEIRSLTSLSESEWKELPKKSVTDIFVSFLKTILSKETEIIKSLQDEFERRKRKSDEEKQQCIDAEKRTGVWAKTLETDLEKLQIDFTEQEQKNRRLRDEVHRLEENLREAHHENQQLHNGIANLESDLNSLHNELDKKSKTNVERDSAISVAQEKERQAKSKEEEWENRLVHERERHDGEVAELNKQLESYKSINDDLKNTVEGLDLEIEHLKNTINIKVDDFVRSARRIEELQVVLERMEDVNQQLRSENQEKNKHVEDITGLLKIKCDLLTEYKTKVENMKPEYESLQAQIAERKICFEKYKEEIQALKLENKKQADVLQDKLSGEEIKSAGLNKQVAELKNKNTALYSTIEEFKDRCAELERENASLQRKVRNSTSKVRVENEMQELQDENRLLKNHLEGSYNRIKELQETKSQVQRELTEVQGKNELLEQELNTTKIALASLREKYNNINLQKLREKYELLLREKNNIILEVEEKKMLIANKDQKLVEYSIEMDTLKKQKEVFDREIENIRREKYLLENRVADLISDNEKMKEYKLACDVEKNEAYKLVVEEKNKISLELDKYRQEMSDILIKNKELDEEMDDLVNHIHKQENEIAELHDRLIIGSSAGHLEKLKALEDENEKVKIDLRVTELNCSKLQNEVIRLNSEKEQLILRIEDLNNKIGELESKNSSRCSSKSNSPTTQKGRRRHRRSDLYNQNRNLEHDNDNRDVTDTESPSVTPTPPAIKTIDEECRTCVDLRNRIREMSLDLVSQNSKITLLEVQLQAENFPYQMKCNELQEQLLQVKTRNAELKLEIQKLQRALMKDSSRECQICRQKKLNKTDQAVQVNPDNKISFTGMSSGIVEDHLRLEKMEKERNWMKDLCRSRARKIKDLEQRVRELEGVKTS